MTPAQEREWAARLADTQVGVVDEEALIPVIREIAREVREEAERERDSARAAARTYGQHMRGCTGHPCTCGWGLIADTLTTLAADARRMDEAGCLCGEIGWRHCQIHQDEGRAREKEADRG